jgi:ATP-dependent Clp protease adaptor protein ClpS
VVNEQRSSRFLDFGNDRAAETVRISGGSVRTPVLTTGGGDDNRQDNGGDSIGTGTDVIAKPRTHTKKPRLYKVLLLNDDYTPMDFVVYVLEQFFNKSRSEATGIMLKVHRNGVGVCGVFTYEVAETKVSQVMNFARQNEHPLQCTMEKE